MRTYLALTALVLATTGCDKVREVTGGGGETAAEASDPNVQVVKSTDGSFEGEIIGGPPAPGSKLSKVKIGMRDKQVESLIGPPDDTDTHITGKQFIPFFFGGDTHRLEAFYKGEGIVTYSPQHMAGQPNTVIRIIVDPSEDGWAN